MTGRRIKEGNRRCVIEFNKHNNNVLKECGNMDIGLIHLVSDVHNEGYIDITLDGFLSGIEEKLGSKLQRLDIDNIPADVFPVVFVKSGGVEGKFKEMLNKLREPYILLASSMHNSFAASLEILSYLKSMGRKAEIVHGDSSYMADRIARLCKVSEVEKRLHGTRLGVVGKPSDWLISSDVNYETARKALGVSLMDIELEELAGDIESAPVYEPESLSSLYERGFSRESIDGALKIYRGFRALIERYKLDGITVRCFDLLERYKNTGCLGMSLLNDEGKIAGCEGDVPALLSMLILNYLTGEPVFMANPSQVDIAANKVILAHCTLPMSMADEYFFDTHFESRLGVGIRGIIREGRGTMFKLSQSCSEFFVSGINIMENLNNRNLCRTQIAISMDEDARYFLKRPLGNHHIVCRGDYSSLVRDFFDWIHI
jgi:L-fucose isomerase-like protein